MSYQHTRIDGTAIDLPVGKAVCVGRNFAEHAREMGQQVPESPMLFIKPSTAFVGLDRPLRLPAHGKEVHHELELAVLIGDALTDVASADVAAALAGYALAIDLTVRDVQAALKHKGHPWEIAKGFDGSCPVSPVIGPEEIPDPQNLGLRLSINGEVRQQGNTRDMVTGVFDLVAYASRFFTLLPGDMVLTGTPAGVGPVRAGDRLELWLDERYEFFARVEGG